MDNKSFWLANIRADTISVSLVISVSGHFKVSSIGPEVLYQATNDSFVAAVNQSLFEASENASIPESDEPNSIALIISPFWVGSDGKILADKIKLFENVFKELKLSPMGFICYDDAIVEEANISDGFPASFIIANLESSSMIVSLTYLGKAIERIHKPLPELFDPAILESTLLEFKTDSTLPPQIILLGDVDDETYEKVKNYSWIGKKNIETFLHFPEIKRYSALEINTIYTKAITTQFQTPENMQMDDAAIDISEEVEAVPDNNLIEVDPDDLGFSEADNFTVPETIPEIIDTEIKEPKRHIRIALPKISLPHFKLPKTNIFLYLIVVSPLLILIPFFFSTAKVVLYVTPYKYSKTINMTLNPTAQTIDIVNKIAPVDLSTTTSTNTASIPTTGKKIIGQKAQGEVTIFNKQDKVQNLPKGTVITDSKGNKYELLNQVQVAASSSDLTQGVINLGKTNAMMQAADIGPEFNLNKDAVLGFKDFNSSILIAKVSDAISGGSKSEVNAVSANDKSNIEAKINSQITSVATDNSKENVVAVSTKTGRIDFNREVGEQSDELTATIQTTIYTFTLDSRQKLNIINSFLAEEPGFKDSDINPDNFVIRIASNKNTTDKIFGPILIEGTSIAKLNTGGVAKLISGKFQSTAASLITKSYPRVYNYKFFTNIPFVPMPFRLSNINIEVK